MSRKCEKKRRISSRQQQHARTHWAGEMRAVGNGGKMLEHAPRVNIAQVHGSLSAPFTPAKESGLDNCALGRGVVNKVERKSRDVGTRSTLTEAKQTCRVWPAALDEPCNEHELVMREGTGTGAAVKEEPEEGCLATATTSDHEGVTGKACHCYPHLVAAVCAPEPAGIAALSASLETDSQPQDWQSCTRPRPCSLGVLSSPSCSRPLTLSCPTLAPALLCPALTFILSGPSRTGSKAGMQARPTNTCHTHEVERERTAGMGRDEVEFCLAARSLSCSRATPREVLGTLGYGSAVGYLAFPSALHAAAAEREEVGFVIAWIVSKQLTPSSSR
ncbi:uncharacterized protein C8Q71DRAFT_725196 [Rhodofomes roseus]|uniref:Uncharacterized protein n=1 Tax=Rhodofomes roseus TaxID=34475 RepID=A0ABQ8KBA8_9APHY|nr:uncharacterized protein C8Q71DRAFT_725196 [Rhodofomes roseus]KAH9834673.1 hypothetical protein C8Q71DRAFT_725196 [Rhodofomes roseus]